MKTNYHTHCTFCDGKNTMEEMVQAAISSGFDILGFSSHAMTPFNDGWHIPADKYQEYCDTFRTLKAKYSDKIELYLGFEADYIKNLSSPDIKNYQEYNLDYTIGSVHYVLGGTKQDGYFEADGRFETVKDRINTLYGGDTKSAVIRYFETEREMINKGGFTFLGHPDLIRKQNSTEVLFDETESWYKEQIDLTAKAIATSGICVEINTGGMARGYMSTPFPSPYFLSVLREFNVPVTINSDSHQCSTIDYGFIEAAEYAKKAGYKELMYLTSGSLKSYLI